MPIAPPGRGNERKVLDAMGDKKIPCAIPLIGDMLNVTSF